jgi:pyridoxal phosphate enzyme (YggS family)
VLESVLARIRAACERAGRDAGSVRLVAVTKGRSADEVRSAVLSHGSFALGESRVQEALAKMEALPSAEFHLIGHLQRNKVKQASGFSLIHSLDSVRLAEAIARQAEASGRAPAVLVEVLLAPEGAKTGVPPAETPALVRRAREMGLEVRGLMTIAPQGDPTGAARAFSELREMRDSLGLAELSMGMSDDFPAAIAAGATMVRVGTAIFTPEPQETQ